MPKSQSKGHRLPIKIVDVGAMWVGENQEPYAPLVANCDVEIIGFEPQEDECAKLRARQAKGCTYLPYFIGDGTAQTFYECNVPYTSSLLPPNRPLVEKFQNIPSLMNVIRTHAVQTVRLDDIPETAGVDFLKVDVQGGEMMVFDGARKRLSEALVVHTEIEFMELYKGQPLFGDIDVFLRSCGFAFHRFAHTEGRTFKPLVVNNDINSALSQMLWGDAIYVRDVQTFGGLATDALHRLSTILHYAYRSYDLAIVALREIDLRSGSSLAHEYLRGLSPGPA